MKFLSIIIILFSSCTTNTKQEKSTNKTYMATYSDNIRKIKNIEKRILKDCALFVLSENYKFFRIGRIGDRVISSASTIGETVFKDRHSEYNKQKKKSIEFDYQSNMRNADTIERERSRETLANMGPGVVVDENKISKHFKAYSYNAKNKFKSNINFRVISKKKIDFLIEATNDSSGKKGFYRASDIIKEISYSPTI